MFLTPLNYTKAEKLYETGMSFSVASTLWWAMILALVVWGWWRAVDWGWLRPKKLERCFRKQGLSGNPYRLLHGDMRDAARLREKARSKPLFAFTNDILPRAMPHFHHTILNYGKSSFEWMGPLPMVHITKPELIREVFSNMTDFAKPELKGAARMLAPGMVNYEGDKWAKHRKMADPAFHRDKLKLMLPAFYESCAEMINAWEKKMTHGVESIELDVWPSLTKLTADVISRAAFGSSFKQGRRIFELLSEQVELTVQIFQSVYIPGWSFMPTKANRRMKKVHKEILALVLGIIERRKKAMEAPKGDLLGMLMENAFKSEVENASKHKKQVVGMTTRELIDECKLFYFAGQETTSVLLVWTIILLSKHQVWQERAREEVVKAFGDRKPDHDGLGQLKTLTMILYEVLRLYPPFVEHHRVTKHDVELGNLSLPAGVTMNIPIMLVHQDPELWGNDALEFKPERFSEGIVKATGGNNAFFPFGWGPRICIGQNFTILEAKMALAMILRRFYFELSPSYTHAPLPTITLKPQFGAHIVLRQL